MYDGLWSSCSCKSIGRCRTRKRSPSGARTLGPVLSGTANMCLRQLNLQSCCAHEVHHAKLILPIVGCERRGTLVHGMLLRLHTLAALSAKLGSVLSGTARICCVFFITSSRARCAHEVHHVKLMWLIIGCQRLAVSIVHSAHVTQLLHMPHSYCNTTGTAGATSPDPASVPMALILARLHQCTSTRTCLHLLLCRGCAMLCWRQSRRSVCRPSAAVTPRAPTTA